VSGFLRTVSRLRQPRYLASGNGRTTNRLKRVREVWIPFVAKEKRAGKCRKIKPATYSNLRRVASRIIIAYCRLLGPTGYWATRRSRTPKLGADLQVKQLSIADRLTNSPRALCRRPGAGTGGAPAAIHKRTISCSLPAEIGMAARPIDHRPSGRFVDTIAPGTSCQSVLPR
jgi:hypothetical protein